MTIEKLRMISVKGCDYIFRDLLDVGTKKAMGYLPLSTMEQYGDSDSVDEIASWAEENHLSYNIYTQSECSVGSGALFVWDEKMLQEIINKYKDVLIKTNISITPKGFVQHIIHKTVFSEVFPEVYVIIGYAFNDKRFRGKDINVCMKEVKARDLKHVTFSS